MVKAAARLPAAERVELDWLVNGEDVEGVPLGAWSVTDGAFLGGCAWVALAGWLMALKAAEVDIEVVDDAGVLCALDAIGTTLSN